ncbi:MAG TPA: hypothetical protein GXZ90_00585 [Clostridiales bacterium]|nr:hypothetical protein [Clostridiales bacterium]
MRHHQLFKSNNERSIFMLELEIEYAHYLCQYALSINNHLSNLYHKNSNGQLGCYHSKIENEHDIFLLDLIEASEYWTDIETAKLYDSNVKNYHRLDDLIWYIHSIDYLSKKNLCMFENNNVSISKLSNYQLEDSCLLSFEIDAINHICNITLANVLFYADKRINKTIDVDSGTIVIKFLDVKSLEMKGNIDTVMPDTNIIYKWYMVVAADDNLNNFGLFVIVGHRSFLLNVKYLDMEVRML